MAPPQRGLRSDVDGKTMRLGSLSRCPVSSASGSQPRHIRRFVIDRAPALFLVPCGDPRCTDGEHDLTTAVMRALRANETAFGGTDECTGTVGTSACTRVLHFDAVAEYREGMAPEPPR
jgi:hypothetical protein